MTFRLTGGQYQAGVGKLGGVAQHFGKGKQGKSR
jgi:hypothetical protein